MSVLAHLPLLRHSGRHAGHDADRVQIVQGHKLSEKRLLVPVWMVQSFHCEQFPVDGVMGLIQQCARHRHLRVFEDR